MEFLSKIFCCTNRKLVFSYPKLTRKHKPAGYNPSKHERAQYYGKSTCIFREFLQSAVGSGPRYQIWSHVYARCASQKHTLTLPCENSTFSMLLSHGSVFCLACQKKTRPWEYCKFSVRFSDGSVFCLAWDSRMAVYFLTCATCKNVLQKSDTSGRLRPLPYQQDWKLGPMQFLR